MTRTTERPPSPVATPADVPSRPTTVPPALPLSDRLRALGVIALTGGIGVGLILVARQVLLIDREDTLLPLSETTSGTTQPLRNRISVITPGSTPVTPPQVLRLSPDSANRQAQLRQSPPAPSLLTSSGFAQVEQPGASPSQPVDAPLTGLKVPVPPTAIAAAPGAGTGTGVPPRPAAQPVPPPPLLGRAPAPTTVLSALLEPPRMFVPSTTAGDLTPSGSGTPTASSSIPALPAGVTGGGPQPERIYVGQLRIVGNTRFSTQKLTQVAQEAIAAASGISGGNPALINRSLSPAELVQASEAITKFYTQKGYISSGAYVPAEALRGSLPELRIVEGKIEEIKVTVEPPKFPLTRPLSPSYVRQRLATNIKLPLQIDQLADAVKLLEQDPLIDTVSTELAPGSTTGGSILNVKVRQARPLNGSLSVDNGRSPSVGRLRQQVSASYDNLLGFGERLMAGANRSDGSSGFNAGFLVPINPRNWTVGFNYSRNEGKVIEPPFDELDIRSKSENYELALKAPIIQTAKHEIALTLRGTRFSNEGVFLERFNGGVPIPFPGRGADAEGKTVVTAVRFGQEWSMKGERNVISLQSEFSAGLDALGATILDQPPDGQFLSWQGRGLWVHSFGKDILLAMKGQVLLSDRPLVPVEQISLGGVDTVRGYRTSSILSDNGVFASAEMYLPLFRIPRLQALVQVVPFVDFGQGWNNGTDQPVPNQLLSAGMGLQLRLGDKLRARVDVGFPLINERVDDRSLKEDVHFSIVFTP